MVILASAEAIFTVSSVVIQLMCDEYEQKTRRLEMLREKLKKIKEDQGEIAVSREWSNCSSSQLIYCLCLSLLMYVLVWRKHSVR